MKEVLFERNGDVCRFSIDEQLGKERFRQLVSPDFLWYFKGRFYFRPRDEGKVREHLRQLGYELLSGEYRVVKESVKVIAVLRSLNLKTYRRCRRVVKRGKVGKREVVVRCNRKVFSKDGELYCPKHGKLLPLEVEREWFATCVVSVAGEEELAVCFDDACTSLLHRAGWRKRDLSDQLKGLRNALWLERFKRIQDEVRRAIKEREPEVGLEGELVMHPRGFTFIRARRVMSAKELAVFKAASKFVAGELARVREVAMKALPDYREELEMWGEIPVLRYRKRLGGVEVEVGIRAPVEEYGKAYHIWMRADGTHLFPSTPVVLSVFGREVKKYVWRVMHTAGWERNLRERLEHAKSLEPRVLEIVRAAKVPVRLPEAVLRQVGLEPEDMEAVLNRLPKGRDPTLWELAHLVGMIDPAKGLEVLRADVQLPEVTVSIARLLEVD